MRLDSFLEPEPDSGWTGIGGLRRHHPAPPEPIIGGAIPRSLTRKDRPTSARHQPREQDAWRAQAACAGTDPDLFVPTHEGEPSDKARYLCAVCPVHEPCLEHALTHHEHGYWGRTTDRDRRSIRRRRARAS
jgi:WhiB family redox-sensing transcriptional regulator